MKTEDREKSITNGPIERPNYSNRVSVYRYNVAKIFFRT